MASDITLEYEIATNFQNISDITEIDTHRIKKDISLIISSTDYDSIETQRVEGLFFNITFKNKLTALTTTETDNITAYIQEFPSEKINENLTRQAVVSNDPFNPAKYKCVGHAISDGKKSIFIKASTIPYTLTQDIVFAPGLSIIGEKKGDCVIDLAGHSITTPLLEYTTIGTSVTFTLNSTSVSGVGTTFTTLYNQSTPSTYSLYIEANGQLYEVDNVENDVTLYLKEPFSNNTVTYTAGRFLVGYFTTSVSLRNVTIQNASYTLFNSLANSIFENIEICDGESNCAAFHLNYNLSISGCCFCNTSGVSSSVSNLRLRDCVGARLSNIKCLQSGSSGAGLTVDSDVYHSNEISIFNSYFENNYKGIVIGSSTNPVGCAVTNVVMNNCKVKSNISNGIEINSYYNAAYSPFQNTCVGNIIGDSQISFNGGDGVIMGSELTKITNSCIGFNGGNGVVNTNRNNSIINNFVCFNGQNGMKYSSGTTQNENNIIQNNIIKNNTAHGIYVNDNNVEGLLISGCKIFDNVLNGIFIEPASTTTFTTDKINISNNTLDDDVVIGGKAGCTSNVKRCIIHSNFLKAVTFTANTEALKFVFNFYESLTNEDGTGANLVDGNGFNTVV